MGASGGPDCIQDGLVLCLDAADKNSYPGSGTTWTDLSGNGNHGTLVNGPVFDPGNEGSLSFDGANDYVHGAAPPQNPSAASLEVWYKTSTDEAFPGETRLLNVGTGSFPGVTTAGISLRLRDDKVGFAARKADNTGYWDVYSGDTVIDGTWKHVVGTFDVGSLRRYEDGVLTQETSTGQNYLTSSNGYGIGGDLKYFEGNIAIARVYNRTLTQAEIQQNYLATKTRFGL